MRSQPSHPLRYTFPIVRWVTLAAVAGVGVWALPVRSLPQNGQVKAGEAVIQQPTSDRLNVVQSSDRAVINWTSFGIAGSEWVDFQQPSANSATLNRVTGNFTSEIAGRLTSNGQLFLINPNGILFTPTAQINVGSLLATTLDTKDSDFMQGRLKFWQLLDKPLGKVENQGNITVKDGGFAALVAPGVANSGVINARLGKILLGSGTTATVDFYGDGLISFVVDPATTDRMVGRNGKRLNMLRNSGTLSDGDVVTLSAQTGSNIVNNSINMDGLIPARTLVNRQGKVVLSGADAGSVTVSGTLDVSGQGSGDRGGTIQVLGKQVDLKSTAQLLASGDAGGGTVLVGGDYQGKGSLPRSLNTKVSAGAQIEANALTNGKGGKVIVWSDGVTTMNGNIFARGGPYGGDGGFVETSGKKGLGIAKTANVDVGANIDKAGTWLLDPDRLFIANSLSSDTTLEDIALQPAGDFNVDPSVIVNALEEGNVDLAATQLIQVDAEINSSSQFNENTLRFSDQPSALNQPPDGVLTINLNAPINLASGQTLTGEGTTVNVNQAFRNILQNGVDVAASGATVNVASGTFKGSGESVVNIFDKSLTLRGQGSTTIVDGEDVRRGFNIQGSRTRPNVTLSGFRITNGSLSNGNEGLSDGGGIQVLSSNLTVDRTTISGNSADNGGGIFSVNSTLAVRNSTISGNSADNGGGIYSLGGTINITNSTISGNSAGSAGGGIYNFRNTGEILFSTISNNSAQTGGGLYGNDGESGISVGIRNSIVAGNQAPTFPEVQNIGTGFISRGNNLVGQNGNAGGFPTIASDIILAGPIGEVLGPLADNGGPTQTQALLEGSPAIDAATPADGVTTDQRGISRPQGSAPDIGAFEFVPPPTDTPTTPPTTPPTDSPTTPPTDSPTDTPTTPPATPQPNGNVNEPPRIVKELDTPNPNVIQQQAAGTPPQVNTATSNISPPFDAPVTDLDYYFSLAMTGYLGTTTPPPDTLEQAQEALSKVSSEVPGVNPALVYVYFAPAPDKPVASKPGSPPTLVASTDLSSALRGNLIAQKTEEQGSEAKDKCLSAKPASPSDPIWQFDSCGWERLYPKGLPNQETDQMVIVLVTPKGKVIRKQVPEATRGKVVKAVKRFQGSLLGLKEANAYLPQSQQIYQWLMSPIDADLKARKVNNLVFVMDKGLRSLPVAALHDGTGYIVERYSVGFMPSLALSDTRHVSLKDTQVLAMGAAEFKDQAALPSVPLELSTIAGQLWPGQSFLNETFTPANLKQARTSKSFGIVHLATHGDFQAGRPDRSYIQFWNDKIALNRLQDLELTQATPIPVSLLVLSACRTALGDLDAELGFTGLAVSAGVQTAMGGLWYISDLGTLALMSSFYGNLKTAPIKGEALRLAQVAMLKGQVRIQNGQLIAGQTTIPLSAKLAEESQINLTHPYYWSGITMVGNPW